ncbi:MAG: hypothetical protein A2268_10875 [Candidatus Raymondbacteria bacterium RifOxyA12_full_50_37]|uniref:Photosynthesis system II assembly factor Ycf48/Hcf136-like domain-containing protein n=1 Tax=Candidatus Raymondbacteria bacterium RIFOXYD12_FULL_49_13 TaxID=1817890 RepID=A0A1F7F223_UNCRA|nr:MAG: hypothetical protein A2268_10875 [Candidatus Raymondbacteria bacterium RifOxyA12_full_50_37]OGJ85514.1 MAG: hypothetical protein A2248_12660 [Candidatus Raymondbacteria bacterium RIFOXYA2_FULL_49_16]OGJ95017.1 MAG: hypothetical protein A2453_07360 [Candidatus Raymondbacteria bacterium RIFOXYC2_FULL_50_21]OGK00681.1 MAG: hypothetical protein A2519_19995 [Candidatus Raymondbacteria bacterium RIFOXYD12_FULL_49_13]OGK01286.1 MAG: hypothetical protein A2350_08350 [Candidatus Raymondbacteria 
MTHMLLTLLCIIPIFFCACNKAIEPVPEPSSPPPSAAWEICHQIDSSTYGHEGIFFLDQLNGWIVGNAGKIVHTHDGGISWTPQLSGTSGSLRCVFFTDSLHGWIGGHGNWIGKTTDGGDTWAWQQPAGESRRLYMGLSFVNERIGWIVDNFGGIHHTTDGGITWTPQTSNTIYAITSVQFLDSLEGWATATNRLVLHTVDGGNNWNIINLNSLDYGAMVIFMDLFFINHAKGWIATVAPDDSTNGTIVATTDSGKTWTCQHLNIPFIWSVHFVTETIGWAATETNNLAPNPMQGIWQTYDGGITWEHQFEAAHLNDMFFVDQTHGWATSSSGNIYRFGL